MQAEDDNLSSGDLAGTPGERYQSPARDRRSAAAGPTPVLIDLFRSRRIRLERTLTSARGLRAGKLSSEARRWSLAAGLTFFMLMNPTPALGGAATDQLRQSIEKIQKILSDPSLKGAARAEARRRQLREALNERFDFGEMARRSLGPHWSKRSEAEQKEFVRLFTELLESAYLSKLEEYSGEQVRYVAERNEKDLAEVDTRVVGKKGEEFALDYRLMNQNGQWKIVDVIIENISVVNNYRSQFARVLSKSSFEELMQTMKQKKPARPGARG